MRWLLLLPLLLLTACGDYSDGERTGTITKFSRKGFFCKTYEGELVMGGLRNQRVQEGKTSHNEVVANIFSFTVEDERLMPIIRQMLESGQPVTLHYRQELLTFCRSDSDDYFVDGVTAPAS